jgi:DNA repair exonuclease SbcCD ATPase subunit
VIIKLKNVRQHEDLVLEFPDTGVIRLNGRSGIGKTTVFDAVEEALYGSASDIAPWGSSKSSVELIMGQLKIIRTRGPQTLTVTIGDRTYKDDEAQDIINKTLGMTEQEFLACSYIKQGSANSLLSLGPADQLRFIESLSVGDSNPEKIKDKIKTLIKNNELEVAKNLAKYKELLKKSEENQIKIHNLTHSLGEKPTLPFTAEDKLKKESIFLTNNTIIARLEEDIAKLDEAISNPMYELLNIGNDIVASNESKISAIESMIAVAESEIADLRPWSDRTESDSMDLASSIKKQREMLEIKDKMKALSKEIALAYPDIRSYASVTSLLENKIATNKEKISNLVADRFQAIEKQREIDALKTPQYCPVCASPLSIVSNKIVSTVDVPNNLQEIKQDLKDLIQSLNQQIAESTGEERRLNQWLLECARLKQLLPQIEPRPDLKTIDECDRELSIISKYISDNIEISLKLKEKVDTVRKNKDTVLGLRSHNKSTLDRLAHASLLPTQESLLNKKSEIISRINDMKLLQSEIKAEIGSFDNASKAIERYESIEKVLYQLKLDQEQTDKEIISLGALDKNLSATLAASIRLKELSDFAAVSAIDSTLEDINACSAFFLEKMFPDDGTVIKLKNSTTTKTGEERAKLSIEVFHKGKYAKRLSNLSGGEKSRACLAFQLGLSELYKSPILMIDEGFSGLGDTDKEQCLEILHDIAKDKLVLVIEHGAGSSHFDATIDIGE